MFVWIIFLSVSLHIYQCLSLNPIADFQKKNPGHNAANIGVIFSFRSSRKNHILKQFLCKKICAGPLASKEGMPLTCFLLFLFSCMKNVALMYSSVTNKVRICNVYYQRYYFDCTNNKVILNY
jgi:hypothetical protein